MLVAKTIEADSLDKMIVYYKTIDGEWIDAISLEAVDEPIVFKLNYFNTKLKLYSPSFSIQENWDYVSEITGPKEYYFDLVAAEKSSGLEIYYSLNNSDFQLLTTISSDDYIKRTWVSEYSDVIENLYVSESLHVPR